MKNHIALITILILTIGCVNKQRKHSSNLQNDWNKVESEHGNFSISFPNFKIKEGQDTLFHYGKKKVIYYYSMNTQHEDDENMGYRVDYSFWPKTLSREKIDVIFDQQREYVLSATNGTLLYDQTIDLNGNPGREWYFKVDNKKIKAKYRMYFNNGIVYKLMVVTHDGKLFNNSIAKYFYSFRIHDDKN